ncbi:MAG TPA: hypothetical protein VGP63_24570 [Planctomycetaceae bacterium]|jgi:hypothetical protein|nr:hypothetical protein [Planctomycetaceae bacterium]
MFRVVISLVVVTVCHVVSDKASFGQDASANASAEKREKLLRSARARMQKWPKLGMWLPQDDVPFFSDNFVTVEPVLRGALSDSNEDVRKGAAYVIRGIGPKALSLEPTLVERIERDPSRLVRMYLYQAARSAGGRSDKMLACLRRRFGALEKERDLRQLNDDYTATAERIEVASALLKLDTEPARKTQYRDFVLRWLKPPPAGLEYSELKQYWEHCWIAVNVVENTGGPREAASLLEAMRKDPRRKAWVYVKVSRALEAIAAEAGQKTRLNALNSDQARLRSLFASSPGQEGKELPNRKAGSEHRVEWPNRNLTVSFDDNGDAIVVSRAGEEKRLTLPSGSFWGEPVFTPNGKYVFALENRGSQRRGFSESSIDRIQLPDASEGLDSIRNERILSTSGLQCPGFKDPCVHEIYAASQNGKRLLVQVRYTDSVKSSSSSTYYVYRPFFLDTESKSLKVVEP